MLASTKRQYFENLDGLRLLLATAVLSAHSMLGDSLKAICPSEFVKRIISTFSNGPYGVSFFFVLSGFLITYLMLEEQELTSGFSIKNFYVRRILRIWPVYYGLLVFTFIIYPKVKVFIGIADQNPFDIVHQMLFLANFDSIRVNHLGLKSVAPMMVNINWSVSIEEQFYLVWPMLFLIFRGRKFIIAILISLLGCWLFRLCNTDGDILYYHTLAVVGDLAIGATFAYFSFYRQEQIIALLTRLNRIAIMGIYISGILLLMYNDVLDPLVFPMIRVANALFFAFVILEQSFSPNSFFKFSNAKRLSAMGKYTYSLYMLHPLGIQTAILVFRYTGIQRENSFGLAMLYVLISFIVAFALAIASYHLVESKFLTLRKKFR